MEILKSVIYGIVEGITEWLPISSTGHLILFQEFIPFANVSEDFWNLFLVVIQLGAILAVVVNYFYKLFPFCSDKSKHYIKLPILRMWYKVIFASIPAGVIGLLFDDVMEKLFFTPFVVALMLILYGIFFILLENKNRGKRFKITNIDRLPYRTAFGIGLFQVLALIPGTSRSGATILGAMILGCSRTVSAEFTFFLAIPAMFGASLLKLFKFGLTFTGMEMAILSVGIIVSFVVSLIVIKFLMQYIKKHDFKVFGYYRIILGIIVLLYFFLVK